MAIISVSSSALSAVEYHEKEKSLDVYFKDGTFHSYSGVSKKTFEEMMKAKSIGGYFNSKIRENS